MRLPEKLVTHLILSQALVHTEDAELVSFDLSTRYGLTDPELRDIRQFVIRPAISLDHFSGESVYCGREARSFNLGLEVEHKFLAKADLLQALKVGVVADGYEA
jgi:hypothetical protein